jgi:plastocyanin domain-containing protein
VKTVVSLGATTLIAASIFAGTVLADPPVNQTSERKQKVEERTIFVTGSLIPQRIKLQPIGTTTVSPVRIIDRREIDQTGRRTTQGALINEPSLRVIGH